MTNPLNLYIHSPFCTQKCNYCAFFSQAGQEKHISAYCEALMIELKAYENSLEGYEIKTIYMGGGTPSLIDPQIISGLLALIRQILPLSANPEITLEANPESVTLEKLRQYFNAGINRLSLGLQAWQDKTLEYLGRKYTHTLFEQAYRWAQEAGFTNINIDCIFGIPGQTMKDWQETLDQVVHFQPAHVACYSLELDHNSVFGKLYKMGKFEPADEKLDRDMYYVSRKKLAAAGYHHYEISNFALPHKECQHNLDFWQYHPYVGIGAGAHSFFNLMRWNNCENIEKYITQTLNKQSTKIDYVKVTEETQEKEAVMLGLRLIDGMSTAKIDRSFVSKLKELSNKGMVEITDDIVKLTPKGMDLENQVFLGLI